MDISNKSIATMIDELITTSMKCWYAQEIVMKSDDEKEIATASKSAQLLNKRRNQLIRAIDKQLGNDSITITEKTY